jgi:hypothetical protein
MLQPGQAQPPAQVQLTDLALINVPVAQDAFFRYDRPAPAPSDWWGGGPAPGPVGSVPNEPAMPAMGSVDPAPAPGPFWLGQQLDGTARVCTRPSFCQETKHCMSASMRGKLSRQWFLTRQGMIWVGP